MAFEAKFAGKCSECGQHFAAGEQITGSGGAYAHEVCVGLSRLDLGPKDKVCELCWLVKPCGCEDGL